MPKWLRAKIIFPATATKRGKRRATCWALTLQNLFDIFNSLAALSSPGGVVNAKLKVGSSIRFPTKCEKSRLTKMWKNTSYIKDIWPIESQGSRRRTHQQRCSRPSHFWTRQAFSQVISCLLWHYIMYIRVFLKGHFVKKKMFTPPRNWGVPRKIISRRRGWSDKSWGSALTLKVWWNRRRRRNRRRQQIFAI